MITIVYLLAENILDHTGKLQGIKLIFECQQYKLSLGGLHNSYNKMELPMKTVFR